MNKYVIPEKREDAIKFIDENFNDIYQLKKKTIKIADAVFTGNPISFNGVDANKSTPTSTSEIKDATATFVANTYLWLDSHMDVHDYGVFANSIKEQKDKLFHLHDHRFELSARVGDVKRVSEEVVGWRELGVDRDGETQILKVVSNIQKRYNETIFEDYVANKINQHSIAMRYIKLKYAVDNPNNEDAYKVYKSYIDRLGNKEVAEQKGYFWVVEEAALREFSCVLLGSNEVTPTLNIETKTKLLSDNGYMKFLNLKSR